MRLETGCAGVQPPVNRLTSTSVNRSRELNSRLKHFYLAKQPVAKIFKAINSLNNHLNRLVFLNFNDLLQPVSF